MSRKLILYIAQSLDGYIAAPNDNLDFLNTVAQEGEDYGYANFISTVDTVLIGRRTYDWILKQIGKYPNSEDKKTYVITCQEKSSEGNVIFSNERLKSLVHWLKYAEEEQTGKDIFCDGGADLVNSLLQEDLIDEMIISVIPVFLGNSIKLFQDGRPFRKLELMSSKSYESGLLQVHYKCLISREEWLEKIQKQVEFLISISDSEGVKLLDERLSEIIVEEPEKFQCKKSIGSFHFFIPSVKRHKVEKTLIEKLMYFFSYVPDNELKSVDFCLWQVCVEKPDSIILHNWQFMMEIAPNFWAVAFDFKPQFHSTNQQ